MPQHWLENISIYIASAYVGALALLLTPQVQIFLIYLAWLPWPLFPDFQHPEKYGTLPGQVRNFYITTPDGVQLGVYHALPESIYNQYIMQHGAEEKIPDSLFIEALKSEHHPVILYCHGNAASRLAPARMILLRLLSTGHAPFGGDPNEKGSGGLNFITFDYRGFGDSRSFIPGINPKPAKSTLYPSQKGLITDVKAIWDWLTVENGVDPSRIGVSGQSLGTGVASALVGGVLAHEGVVPKALILICPYRSIAGLLETYRIAKFLPVLQPIKLAVPLLFDWAMKKFLREKWETEKVIANVQSKILLLHARDDIEIPNSHSRSLFQTAVSPFLPNTPSFPSLSSLFSKDFSANELQSRYADYENAWKELVQLKGDVVDPLQKWGSEWTFQRDKRGDERVVEDWGEVKYVELVQGGHDGVSYSGIGLDSIRRVMST